MSDKYSISLDQLKQEYIWALWGWRPSDKEPNKLTKKPLQVPVYPGQPEYGARVDHPNDWKSYKVAAAKYAETAAKNLKNPLDRYEGVGLYFANLGSYSLCGLDIDAHKEAGNPHTAALLQHFAGTYMEYSPSGNGIHIIMLMQTDKIPNEKEYVSTYYQKNTKEDLEFYPSRITNRFFTFTGKHIGECSVIADMTDEALAFLEKYMRKPQKAAAPAQPPRTSSALDAAEIERRISRACLLRPGFKALYVDNDKSKYNNDDSAADQALCAHLAYYFDCNAEVMDEVFRKSALYRSKWDERRGAQTYGEMTIAKAISTHTGHVYSDALNRPMMEGGKRTRITIDALADELKRYGYTARLNEISYEIDVEHANSTDTESTIFDSIVATMHSDLSGVYTGCSFSVLEAYLAEIARRTRYNPVLEYLHTLVWDGEDYLERFYDLLRIEAEDWLSRVLIRKWLLQTYGILFNSESHPICADGVLTISGGQGWGKSSIFAMLALKEQWFGGGYELKTFDKDTERWACSRWIVEFGEVENSFSKASAEEMKKFISKKMDRFRPPYAHSDVYKPRRTSLCATCNNDRYLIDQTGNRRWYTIQLREQIPFEEIASFPAEQLWAQIVHIANNGAEDERSWYLRPDELDALNHRNDTCQKAVKSEEEVIAVLDWAANYPNAVEWLPVTVTDWVSRWSDKYKQLGKYTSAQIGKALGVLGHKAEHGRVNGTLGRYYTLPIPR